MRKVAKIAISLPEDFLEVIEEEYKLWLNRLGNLAMLCGSKNYKAQYYDFDRKKKIYAERNKKVSFDLTKEICDSAEWTASVIKSRHDKLIELAKQTWTIIWLTKTEEYSKAWDIKVRKK